MPRSPDPVLRAAWQRRLQAFASFSGTVQEFCERQGVSVATFYQWRRKLGKQPPLRPNRKAAALEQKAPQFIPLKVVGGDVPEAGSGGASIRLPGGTRIEVTGGSLELVEAVLRSVVRHDASLIGQGHDAATARQGGLR